MLLPADFELARFLTPHAHQHGLTRRRLLAAGAAATAVIATTGVMSSTAAAKSGTPTPVPANPAFGGLHVYGVDPTMEPSAITNFHGAVGAAAVNGTGTWEVEGKTPETLLFDSDMRFMQGVFRGTDGRDRKGTFAFTWLDVYRGVVDPLDPNTHQIVDNNPGIAPDGLLWTIQAPTGAAHVDLEDGTARYRMSDVRMRDYGTLANALFAGGVGIPGPSVPSTVSWDLRFHGVTGRGRTVDPTVRFVLDWQNTNAHLDWSMDSGDRSFETNPAGQTAVVAFIGRERNGVFFDTSEDNSERD